MRLTEMKLTDKQIWTAINALHVAAVQYVTDAHWHKDEPNVFEQFTAQARDANALADYLEAADAIYALYRLNAIYE